MYFKNRINTDIFYFLRPLHDKLLIKFSYIFVNQQYKSYFCIMKRYKNILKPMHITELYMN